MVRRWIRRCFISVLREAASGPRLARNGDGEDIFVRHQSDPRIEWEHERDQDLSTVVTDAIVYGWDDRRSATINRRFDRALRRRNPTRWSRHCVALHGWSLRAFAFRSHVFGRSEARLAVWLLRADGSSSAGCTKSLLVATT